MAKRTTKIDELNILRSDESSEYEEEVFDRKDYIEHYFDVMPISEKQKRARIEEAEELFDAILLFLIWCDENPENVQLPDTQRDMQNLYKEVVFQHVEPSDFIDIYVPLFIGNLVDVTVKNQGDEYYTSVERAANVACNEANTVSNYFELQTAKELGYKYKQWHTELDEKVRTTHQVMEGKTIPIDEPFKVGASLMMMPHDISLGADASEIVNCRCALSFLDTISDKTTDIENETENDTIKLPDEQIFKTLSAAARNYEIVDKVTGEVFYFVEGTKIQNREIFAGYGTNTPMHDNVKVALSETHKVEQEFWQHGKGIGHVDFYGEDRLAEVHWFQHKDVGKIGFKIKRWLE